MQEKTSGNHVDATKKGKKMNRQTETTVLNETVYSGQQYRAFVDVIKTGNIHCNYLNQAECRKAKVKRLTIPES